MKLNGVTAKKLASLSALGAGALLVGPGEAEAGIIYQSFSDARVGISSGFTTSFRGAITVTNAAFGGVGFRFFTNRLGLSVFSAVQNDIQFQGLGGLRFATSAGGNSLMRIVAPHRLDGGGSQSKGLVALRNWGYVPNRHPNFHTLGTSGPPNFGKTGYNTFSTTYNRPFTKFADVIRSSFSDLFAQFQFNFGGHPNFGWVELSLQNPDVFGYGHSFGPNLTVLGWAFDPTGASVAAGDLPPVPSSAPEPGSFAMTGLAALALGAVGVRRWKAARSTQTA